jgi:hypothetical protein
MKLQSRWLAALLILNLWLAPDARSQKPYDIGHMGGSSMAGKLPLEGACFSKDSVPDQAMPSHATNRSVKFAFRANLGWYAIAYSPKHEPKSAMKEYGRFTVASADKIKNTYVFTFYSPDYKGIYKAVVPNPEKPNDLSGKKQAATVELKLDGKELAVTVKKADSNQISLARGDTFRMTAGPRARQAK